MFKHLIESIREGLKAFDTSDVASEPMPKRPAGPPKSIPMRAMKNAQKPIQNRALPGVDRFASMKSAMNKPKAEGLVGSIGQIAGGAGQVVKGGGAAVGTVGNKIKKVSGALDNDEDQGPQDSDDEQSESTRFSGVINRINSLIEGGGSRDRKAWRQVADMGMTRRRAREAGSPMASHGSGDSMAQMKTAYRTARRHGQDPTGDKLAIHGDNGKTSVVKSIK